MAPSNSRLTPPLQTKEEKEKKKDWIDIRLVDEDNKPVPREKHEIILPDETIAEGTLDDKCFARVDGSEIGVCTIGFPRLDEELWERI